MKRTSCLYCNVPFEPGRSDQMFCSDKCGSAYWKEHGTTHNHKDLPHFNCKDCEQCGNQFWYNDYAQRGGQRVPKFCSSRCRTRYFRAHNTSAQFAGKRPQPKQRTEEPKARPFQTGDFRDSLHIPRRWDHLSARDWLGIPRNADFAAARAAFRMLNSKYHPDHNAGAEWPHLKTINAAWDFLKRNR